ncbi:bifunctional folylpolyglutamate synthase/dihydrofolate synthase [Lentibacillus sp. CBA3610]|nr:bifunctional folylpolyglutamate synthase/dihydrofolate synthase [Lentibacillus sp. CBA3610]
MFEHFSQIEAFFQERKQYGVKPGLERIHKLLQLLGNPQEDMNAVHVAGTNGKGSTIHYLKNALLSNGYRIGVFNSPSLEGLTGHILLNNDRISEKALIQYVNDIHPFIKQLDAELNHPTEFEIITVIAFLYFADYADFALIEAGMGGREDTTNCFIPILSIITNVERDHTDFLGESIQSIAYHKAGIIKENRPVIAGDLYKEALSVITEEASKKHAPLYPAAESFQYQIGDIMNSRQTFQWLSAPGKCMDITLNTAGIHQIKNASLAIMALVILEDNGVALDWNACITGLATARIPGRFEQIHTKPAIILDGAHNPAGVQAFTDTLTDYFSDMEKHLVFAAFKDKDLKQMLAELEPHFDSVTLTTFDHPRAAGYEQLQKVTHHPNALWMSDWQKAIEQISCQQDNMCYCVTGSLHFIAIVRKYFEEIAGL